MTYVFNLKTYIWTRKKYCQLNIFSHTSNFFSQCIYQCYQELRVRSRRCVASLARKILPSRMHIRACNHSGLYASMLYAIATYRIVSYPGIVCLLRAEELLAQNVGSGVMNAWNLSMDGAPMINRTCSAYPRWSAPVALYSRERGAEERGEGRARPPEAGRECLPSTSSYRVHRDAARWQIALPFLRTSVRCRAAGGVLEIARCSPGHVYVVRREPRSYSKVKRDRGQVEESRF